MVKINSNQRIMADYFSGEGGGTGGGDGIFWVGVGVIPGGFTHPCTEPGSIGGMTVGFNPSFTSTRAIFPPLSTFYFFGGCGFGCAG